jgi:multidrug transporter EmrE-like cation transporter
MNLLLVATAGLIAAAADWLLVAWARESQPTHSRLVAGLVIYVVAMLLFALSLRRGTLLVNGAMFALVNGITIVVISRVALREVIAPVQWIGIALGIAALVLMEL